MGRNFFSLVCFSCFIVVFFRIIEFIFIIKSLIDFFCINILLYRLILVGIRVDFIKKIYFKNFFNIVMKIVVVVGKDDFCFVFLLN